MEKVVYKVNDLKAISETLDDETIIINFENGNYYSTNKTASIIWHKIKKTSSNQQIIDYLIDNYNEKSEIIEKSVLDIIEFLKRDDLILEVEHRLINNKYINSSEKIAKENFVLPIIERFDDMQEMLLADPIHDVQEQGWPAIKPVNK